MPGGYGTRDTPWGSAGTSSTPSRPERNVRASQPDRNNNRSNLSDLGQIYASSPPLTPDTSPNTAPYKELADNLKKAGMVSGMGVSGQGLWTTAPGGTKDQKVLEYLKNPNVYYSTYGPDTSAYSTAFQDKLSPNEIYGKTGYGGLVYSDPNVTPEYFNEWGEFDVRGGKFTPFNPANYPDQYPGFGGGYNDQGSDSGWGWYDGGGGGGGSGGGGGGYAPPEKFMPRGNPNEAWGPQNPLQQMMISLHGGPGFQQGFARGGIVSLVT